MHCLRESAQGAPGYLLLPVTPALRLALSLSRRVSMTSSSFTWPKWKVFCVSLAPSPSASLSVSFSLPFPLSPLLHSALLPLRLLFVVCLFVLTLCRLCFLVPPFLPFYPIAGCHREPSPAYSTRLRLCGPPFPLVWCHILNDGDGDDDGGQPLWL